MATIWKAVCDYCDAETTTRTSVPASTKTTKAYPIECPNCGVEVTMRLVQRSASPSGEQP